MRLALILGVLAAAAPCQLNFVKNGDFSAVDASNLPLLWTTTSQSFHNAHVADFTFGGVPVFKGSFNCQPGGSAAFTRPYPLVILEQPVVVPGGVPIEFTADIAHSRAAAVNNADRGQLAVYLGTTLLETVPPVMSGLPGPIFLMDRFCARTVLPQGGPMTLKITFYRDYYQTDVYCHLDNVVLTLSPGPAFTFRGDRKLGKAYTYEVQGEAGGSYLVFVGLGPFPVPGGITIGGIGGTFQLNPALLIPIWSGMLDAAGKHSVSPGAFPSNPALAQVPLWFQPLAVTPTPAFGNAGGYMFF